MSKATKAARSLTTALLLALMATPAFATAEPQRQTRTKELSREIQADGRAAALVTSSADIRVVATPDDVFRIAVNLEYWSNDEDWMAAVEQEFDVAVDEGTQQVVFEPTSLPDLGRQSWFQRMFSSRRVSFELDVTFEVPVGTSLAIENRYGEVSVEAVNGPAEISNTSGPVIVHGAVGDVRIENRYGDVTAGNIDGNLGLDVTSGALSIDTVRGEVDITNSYGDVELRNVTGAAEVNVTSGSVTAEQIDGRTVIAASYGTVEARMIGGPLRVEATSGSVTVHTARSGVELRSSYGTIEIDTVTGDLTAHGTSTEGSVRGVTGNVRMENSYGELVIENAGGTVNVDNPSGNVTINGAGGDARISSSYAALRALGIAGSLDVKGNSLAVTGEDIGGGVQVRTSYAAVDVRGVGGEVDVVNQSGAVTVTGLSGDALDAHHRVETSYDDIVFEFPATGGTPSFEIETTYGRITSDFAGTRAEHGSRESMRGEAAAPGATIVLTARSGNISLRQQQ